MTRRSLLAGILGGRVAAAADIAAPSDETRLNGFAERYNRYVETLRQGVIDLKQWGRVVSAWKGLY